VSLDWLDIGIFLPSGEAAGLRRGIDLVARYADDGFGSVWFAQSTGPDPLIVAASIGQHVPSIRFGISVIPTFPRHPVALAAEARTAYEALQGRLYLGIGPSHKASIEGRYHLPYDRPVAHTEEYLRLLRPLLDGHTVDLHGDVLGATIRLTDSAPAGCPLYVAALRPAMLRLAGRLAEGTITWCCGPITVRQQIVPIITEAAASTGRAAPAITVILPVCVTDDEAAGRAKADAALPGYGAIPAYRAVLDREGVTNPGEVAVVGDERSVRRQIEDLFDAGATRFVAHLVGNVEEREAATRTLRSLRFPTSGSGDRRQPSDAEHDG
jgi:F420-dependent oxidoreductase-like protein